jgi:hypothetical protein
VANLFDAMGSSTSSEFNAVRKMEQVVVEPSENVKWSILESGAVWQSGQGKAILTTQGLHLWDSKCEPRASLYIHLLALYC